MSRLVPILLLFVFPAPAAAGRASAPVRLDEQLSATSRPRVSFPQVRFMPTGKRPKGLQGAPQLSEAARYATVKLGRRTLHLAFDAPGGAFVLGRLYPGDTMGRVRPVGKDEVWIEFSDVTVGGARVNVGLRYRGLRLAHALLEPARHRRGRAVLAGAVRDVILVDGDGDGRYDGPGDRWVALRKERAARVRTLHRHEALLLREPQIPFEADGRAITVERVAPDGSSLVLVLDRPRVKMRQVLDRRYAEVRADHFEAFGKERAPIGYDRRRPRVKEPAEWLEITLAEAHERARRAGKPLLVCFFSEAAAQYYRYEYYTFPDEQVDALLRRFLLVRVDVEKDPARSHELLGVRGLPALVPLTVEGKRISFRLRLLEKGRATDLKEKEKAILNWQRPQELVTNLERILKVVR